MKKLHYSWIICLATALVMFCTQGLCVNAFTIYMPYVRVQNGFTNAQSSVIITVRSTFSFLSVLLIGIYYRKLPLRWGMLVGGLMSAAGFVLFGIARTHAVYCIGAALCGLGFGLAGLIPAAVMMEHWFAAKRTVAMGLCTASTGLALLGIPQLLTWLIEHKSLQTAFLTQAAAVAAIILTAVLLLRDRPDEKGLRPYGAEEGAASARIVRHGRSLQKKSWLLLVPLLFLLGGVNTSGFNHLTMLATSQGFSEQTAAAAMTVGGLSLMLAKCLYGWVADKLGMVAGNWIFCGILVAGALCCTLSSSTPVLFAAVCLYCAGLSVASVGITAWAGDLSAAEQYDRTVRRFQTLATMGGLTFSSVPGMLADLFGGSYIPAYGLFLAFAAYILLAIQFIYHSSKT